MAATKGDLALAQLLESHALQVSDTRREFAQQLSASVAVQRNNTMVIIYYDVFAAIYAARICSQMRSMANA